MSLFRLRCQKISYIVYGALLGRGLALRSSSAYGGEHLAEEISPLGDRAPRLGSIRQENSVDLLIQPRSLPRTAVGATIHHAERGVPGVPNGGLQRRRETACF